VHGKALPLAVFLVLSSGLPQLEISCPINDIISMQMHVGEVLYVIDVRGASYVIDRHGNTWQLTLDL